MEERLAQGLPPVLVDPEQFKRVVVNLVDNAAEAMQNSLVKELEISTQPGLALSKIYGLRVSSVRASCRPSASFDQSS